MITKKRPVAGTQKIQSEDSNIPGEKIFQQQRKTAREEQKTKEPENNQKTATRRAAGSPYLSGVAFNANGLHFPIKRHRVAEWI